MKIAALIPARMGSTRFPGKPLVQLAGRPLVVHVLDACRSSGAFAEVRVATDDERIATAVSADWADTIGVGCVRCWDVTGSLHDGDEVIESAWQDGCERFRSATQRNRLGLEPGE